MLYWIPAIAALALVAGSMWALHEARIVRGKVSAFLCGYAAIVAGTATYLLWLIEARNIALYWWHVFDEPRQGTVPEVELSVIIMLTFVMSVAVVAGPYVAGRKPTIYWFMTKRWEALTPELDELVPILQEIVEEFADE